MQDSTRSQELLDTFRAVETPEGITLNLHIAGPVVRGFAWLIDFMIRIVILVVAAFALLTLEATGYGLWLLLYFLLEWFYPIVFEIYRNGATPGKKALGIRVVNDNGTPIDFAASLIRNLLRAADFLPLLYGFALLSMLLSRDSKRLGDIAAGTLVIYHQDENPMPVLPPGPSLPPTQRLNATEQKLIVAFAERSNQLSSERQSELAAILDTLTRENTTTPPVEQLHAQARWFAGGSS